MSGRRLLVRLGSLGDVVLATGAAESARSRWGDRCLDVLVKKEWAEVWEGHPAVDRIWSWPPEERSVRDLLPWAQRLRARDYQAVFDLQGSLRTRTLLALAGLTGARRPRRHRRARRRLVRTKRNGPPAGFRVAASFAETVGPPPHPAPRVYPTAAGREEAETLLGGAGRWGLVPGARHATKRWPLERYAEVGRELAAAGAAPVPVFFGPDEEDRERELSGLWDPGEGWRAIRKPVSATAAGLERLAGVVTNDTGLMHLAAAVGTRVVALFGPTVRSFGFVPWGDRHRVLEVEALSCRPCSLHGGDRCPEGHFRCLQDIPAERVMAAIRSLDPELVGIEAGAR